MSTCPSTQQLIFLLDEELNESESDELFSHVQGCLDCQSRLDEITRQRLADIVGLLPAVGSVAPGSEPAATAGMSSETLFQERECEPPGERSCTPQSPRACGGPRPSPARQEPRSPDSCSFETDSDSNPTTDGLRLVPETTAETMDRPSAPLDHPSNPNATCDLQPATRPDQDLAFAYEHDPQIPVETRSDDVTTDRLPPTADATGLHVPIVSTEEDAGSPATATSSGGLPRIPGYELLAKLGQGGMGVVYKARQLGLNRLVAVKMIRGGGQARPDHFARFRVEAEAVAQLHHPNIIQIHDIGEVDELPYVSLELLEGGDLADRLAGSPQPGRSAAELMITLAKAIQVAHEAGIIHRDLKPPNILYTADGVPKVTDFGLAKRLESDSNQTETGQIMGSPSYMAPEQARGHTKDVGPAADIYALGAIFYEMLTGRPPFKGESPIETIRQVTDDEVVPPSRLVPKVARDLETICLKCLNKEPQKRYASARDLADDLERFLEGRPIKARPTPLLERTAKWARRRPVAASLIGLGIASFLGLTIGGAFYERGKRLAEADAGQA